jgi:ATP-binding cassette subfamily C protein
MGETSILRRAAIRRARPPLVGIAIFSAVVNLLMLTGPLFMLQVYDRVLASRSSATLLVLFALVVFLYVLMGLLDHYRGRALARIGAGLQSDLDAPVLEAVLARADHPEARGKPDRALQDLAQIRTTLASPGVGALFDLPWTPLFVAVMFLFHPWLGWFALTAALIVLVLALLNQARTRGLQAEAARLGAEAEGQGEVLRRQIETVRALGLTAPLSRRWRGARDAALAQGLVASDRGGGFTSGTKALRLLLQSAVLGLGALLVLRGELTPGAMIAGSILLGRALAPVEQTVAHLPQIQQARAGWRALSKLLATHRSQGAEFALPRPEPRLVVRGLTVIPPGQTEPVLRDISFEAGPGDAIAVIGPSASGKSSLARALAGLWPPTRGEIRLGGAEIGHYGPEALGRHLGYLAQDVALFEGTVAENIARFDESAAEARVIEAAQQAGAHDLILALPDGYATRLTEGAARLSGGQRQRIGLARAFHGDPVLLVLDEPNAALDDQGVQALNRAIAGARAAGKLVVIMSHRPSALTECSHVLVLAEGRLRAFGPRDEILKPQAKSIARASGQADGRVASGEAGA